MTVKSIVDVEVNDGAFKDFSALFEKYQAALQKTPAAWRAVNGEIGKSSQGFQAIASALLAQQELMRKQLAAERAANNELATSERLWTSISRRTGAVVGHVRDITTSLLRWTAITGVFSGLLGAGGLFGLDRLALGVGANRRSSLGLGTGYGERQAFTTNFSRLVDPESFLSSVAGAKLDVTRRVGLLGLGQGALSGSTAQTSVALLEQLKRIADTTNPALYAQTLQSRRLDQFASPEDLQRLRNTSRGEFAGMVSAYGRNRGEFDLPADTSRKWQEFATQMTRAGQGIEATFVRGLVPLTPGLTRLSESVQRAVETLLSSDKLKVWIEQFGTGIEKAAKYIGTDEFQTKVRNFVDGVGRLANAVVSAVSWLAGNTRFGGETDADVAEREAGRRRVEEMRKGGIGGFFRNFPGAGGGNNPGNLRPPGASTGFRSFGTGEEGVRAMASQLRLYQSRDRLDTITGIVSKYAPASENNTGAYVSDVSRRTGFGPNQKLDLGNAEVLSRLLAAMIAHEQRAGRFDQYKDAKVVVQILKPAGGETAVSVNSLKN